MRSRYVAFARGLGDYLLQTWHPRTRPDHVDTGWPGLRWLGLEIRRTGIDGEGRDFVEFVARNKAQGRAARLHETSWFERVDGRWFYVEGRIHP